MKNGCPLFADDTTAYAVGRDALTTCSNLTKNLDAVCTWAATLGYDFNAEKSDHLSVCNKFRLEQVGPLSRLSMTGQPVPMSKTKSKHLGVLLNRLLATTISIWYIQHVLRSWLCCGRLAGNSHHQHSGEFMLELFNRKWGMHAQYGVEDRSEN